MSITTIVTFLAKNEAEIRAAAIKNNYQGQVLISDQCDQERTYSFQTPKATITVYESKSRGVSKARNAMADLASGDLITFADDDVRFPDDFAKEVLAAFAQYPQADAIRFDLVSENKERPLPLARKEGRLHFHDVSMFGAIAYFIKTDFLKKKGLRFDENCGPGTPIIHGEDSLFIHTLFQQGAKVYAKDKILVSVGQWTSTWYQVNEEQEIVADGYLYRNMVGPFFVKPIGFIHLLKLRHKKIHTTIPWKKTWSLFKQGIHLAK
jgi:glycosyltransferase involved in cell wall biosynthesis